MRPGPAALAFALFLLPVASASACRAAQGSPPSTGRAATRERPAGLDTDAPALLAPGDEVAVEGRAVRLRFAAVVEDSRCPREVTCVWAGRAVVEVAATVGADGPERTARLEVGAQAGGAHLFGVRVAAESLEPWPRAGQPTRPEEYRLRLVRVPEGR